MKKPNGFKKPPRGDRKPNWKRRPTNCFHYWRRRMCPLVPTCEDETVAHGEIPDVVGEPTGSPLQNGSRCRAGSKTDKRSRPHRPRRNHHQKKVTARRSRGRWVTPQGSKSKPPSSDRRIVPLAPHGHPHTIRAGKVKKVFRCIRQSNRYPGGEARFPWNKGSSPGTDDERKCPPSLATPPKAMPSKRGSSRVVQVAPLLVDR